MSKIYTRQEVYLACLLAASRNSLPDCAFGNACGDSNNGEYKSDYYQSIAKEYGEEAIALGYEACWEAYTNRKRIPIDIWDFMPLKLRNREEN